MLCLCALQHSLQYYLAAYLQLSGCCLATNIGRNAVSSQDGSFSCLKFRNWPIRAYLKSTFMETVYELFTVRFRFSFFTSRFLFSLQVVFFSKSCASAQRFSQVLQNSKALNLPLYCVRSIFTFRSSQKLWPWIFCKTFAIAWAFCTNLSANNWLMEALDNLRDKPVEIPE